MLDRESLLMLLMFACLLAFYQTFANFTCNPSFRSYRHVLGSCHKNRTIIDGIFAMAQVAAMAGSTRKIHVLHGAVHVVVDHGSTAGDFWISCFFVTFCQFANCKTLSSIMFILYNGIGSQTSMFLRCLQGEIIERVWATLPDVPCHGHTLLSSGLKKFNHSDVVPDGDHLAFANYSLLAGPGRLQIPTERSGITIPQIQALLDFVYGMIGVSKPGLWAASFGEEHGRPLSFDTFNLYHADEWIIRPATAAVPGSSHGTGCSYVELLGNKFSYFS